MAKPMATIKLLLPVSLLLAFVMGYYTGTYQFALLSMATEFALSNAQLGVLAGASFFAQMLLPVLFGVIADRRWKKPLLMVSCICLFIGVMMMRFAAGYEMLIAALFFGGTGFGTAQTLYLSALADSYPQNVTRNSNLCATLQGGGSTVAPLIGGMVLGMGMPWRNLFVPLAVMLVAGSVLLVFTAIKQKQHEAGGSAVKITELFRQPIFYMVIIGLVLYLGIESPTASFSDTYFVRDLGAAEYSAVALALYWGMTIPSRLIFGAMKKNHGRWAAIFWVALIAVTLLIAWTGDPLVATIGFAASGFLCGPIWPTLFAYGQKAFPGATATMGSFCLVASGLGGSMFPMLMGALSEGRHIAVVYYCIAAVAIAGAALMLATNRKAKKLGIG